MLRPIFLLSFGFLWLGACYGQDDWKLRNDRDSIKTFTSHIDGDRIKSIKAESIIPASLKQLASVIMDVDHLQDWVYSTKSSSLLKRVSQTELYYYSEVNFPWPATNRDFVAHLTINQDPKTRVITIRAENVQGLVPEKRGIVRIIESIGRWTITPIDKNLLRVSYVLRVDPDGNIPPWMVNLFSTKGLFQSFKNLRSLVQRKQYSEAKLPFITE